MFVLIAFNPNSVNYNKAKLSYFGGQIIPD